MKTHSPSRADDRTRDVENFHFRSVARIDVMNFKWMLCSVYGEMRCIRIGNESSTLASHNSNENAGSSINGSEESCNEVLLTVAAGMGALLIDGMLHALKVKLSLFSSLLPTC